MGRNNAFLDNPGALIRSLEGISLGLGNLMLGGGRIAPVPFKAECPNLSRLFYRKAAGYQGRAALLYPDEVKILLAAQQAHPKVRLKRYPSVPEARALLREKYPNLAWASDDPDWEMLQAGRPGLVRRLR